MQTCIHVPHTIIIPYPLGPSSRQRFSGCRPVYMYLIQSLYLIHWGHLHGRGFSGCRHVPHTIIIPYQLGPSSRREVLVDADMYLIHSLYLINWGHLHGRGFSGCRHGPHTIITPYQLGPSSRREVLVDADMVLIQSLYLINWGHLHGSYIKGYLKCTFL